MQYKKDHIIHQSIREFKLRDGTVIGVFAGTRGHLQSRDIIIKYKTPKQTRKTVRTPAHIHWAIDLLIKREHQKKLTIEFMEYLLNMYDRTQAFKSKKERDKCAVRCTSKRVLKKYEKLNKYGEYKVEFIEHLIKLMIKMEKNTPPGKPAKVFRELMKAILENKDIFTIVNKAKYKGAG